MFWSCREALTDAREWSGVLPECPVVVGGPPGYPGVVKRRARIFGCGQVAIPIVRE